MAHCIFHDDVIYEDHEKFRIIKNHLKGIFPVYMIPSFFVKITSLPLTSNGKVDRRLLASPLNAYDFLKPKNNTQHNAVEVTLTEICKDLLNIDAIDANEDLTNFGMDSLRIILFSLKIQACFGQIITTVDCFKYSSIAELSRLILLRQNEFS